jgi:hypothetical protein
MTNWNGGIKCAINQPYYPLFFMSSSMQSTIIVNAEAIFNFNNPKKGKAELKKAMKAFRKRKKVENKT